MQITREEILSTIEADGLESVESRLLQMNKTKREEFEKVISEIKSKRLTEESATREQEAIEVAKKANYLSRTTKGHPFKFDSHQRFN